MLSRPSGASRRGHSSVLGSLFPTERAAPIVAVLDGHPHTLSFLGAINSTPIACLGVTDFGQVGEVEDLYRHFGIDASTIIGAAWDLLDERGKLGPERRGGPTPRGSLARSAVPRPPGNRYTTPGKSFTTPDLAYPERIISSRPPRNPSRPPEILHDIVQVDNESRGNSEGNWLCLYFLHAIRRGPPP